MLKRKLGSALGLGIVGLVACNSSVYASCTATTDTIYGLAVSVGADCGRASANTAQDLINLLDNSGLSGILPSYTDTSAATVGINFNTLPINVSFDAGHETLNFSIPALNVNQSFTGATRDASADLLETYLKDNGIIAQIMNYQAKTSPNSPITGQAGLIPTAISSDFNQSFTESATNIAGSAATSTAAAAQTGGVPNLIGIAAQYFDMTANGQRSKVITLPLSYTIRNDIDPRRQLLISIPLSQSDVNGAKAYTIGAGLAYRFPMNDHWTLTPSAKFSMVGSVDLATVAALNTFSLTSTYIFNLEKFDVAIGNMVTYNKTAKFSAGDYSFDPGIKNTAMRNGVMLSQPVTIKGKKMSLEYSLIDTRYIAGDKPYSKESQELGLTIGTNKNAYSAKSFLRGGLSYVNAKGSHGFTANVGYWF
jgi:hypothetical protein